METTQPERASERRLKTRERLLDAAYEVFAEVGVDAAPVELIAERAGFTRGAFYSNFESKNELFVALAERENERRMAQLQVGLETVLPRLDAERLSRMSTDDKLSVIGDVVAEFLKLQGDDRQWCLIAAEFRLHALRNTDFGRYVIENDTAMEEQLAQIIADSLRRFGQSFVVEPVMAVRLIVSAYQQVTERALMSGSSTPTQLDPELRAVIASVVTLFTETTGAPDSATS